MRTWALVLLLSLLAGCIGTPKNLTPDKPLHPSYVLEGLTVEIQPVHGRTFAAKQITIFKNRFEEYGICAVQNISFVVKPSVSSTKTTWSHTDILNFKNKYRTLFDKNTMDRHMFVFLAHVTGRYNYPKMENVAGIAIGNDFIVYFDRFETWVQSSILVHEVGHLLGLVDRSKRAAAPINPDRSSHCNTENCVMFWQADHRARFDKLCQRDLKAMIVGTISAAVPCRGCRILKR